MLLGNTTRDIEFRYTPKNTAVADLSLAINRKRKDESGNQVEEVTFVDVTLWGRVAEIASQYVQKGDPLFVEGRLHLDQWEDRETGQKRQRLKVIGENIQLLGGGDRAARQPQGKPLRTRTQEPEPQEMADEEIPF